MNKSIFKVWARNTRETFCIPIDLFNGRATRGYAFVSLIRTCSANIETAALIYADFYGHSKTVRGR